MRLLYDARLTLDPVDQQRAAAILRCRNSTSATHLLPSEGRGVTVLADGQLADGQDNLATDRRGARRAPEPATRQARPHFRGRACRRGAG